jgi:hypothetical protein
MLNDVSAIHVPGGELKLPDFDTETPLVIVADEAFPLRHNYETLSPTGTSVQTEDCQLPVEKSTTSS